MKLYILHGDPHVMARPRFGRGRVYDQQAQLKLILGIDLRNQHAELPPYTGPLGLDVVFYFQIPERIAKRARASFIDKPCVIHKDLDNLIKLVGDLGQNAGLYINDSQICTISARKLYCLSDPRTEFSLCEL